MSNLNKFGITEAQMLAMAAQNGVRFRFGDDGVRCLMAYSQALLSLAAPASGAAVSGELPELPEPLEIDWPQLHSVALGCGVEDRNIHDRYEAAEYGWQDGVDKAAERVPEQIYDAEQMREYGAACHALGRGAAVRDYIENGTAIAHQPPKAALTDDEIIAQWLELDTWPSELTDTIMSFARAIEAASAPNPKLVAALQGLISDMEHEVHSKHRSLESARAALASAGVEVAK